jgi:MYXO-CTERM domain-containing protein
MLSAMSRALIAPLCLACVCAPILLTTTTADAIEGQWKPAQIAEIHPEAAKLGLELDAEQLWNESGDERTGGLLRAVVNFGGCSAAFISADGLIATNHHCAYGSLQANSTVEHDYLKDGFLAETRQDELSAPGQTIKLLHGVTDVTPQVRARLAEAPDDLARAKAYDAITTELVDACEAAAQSRHCRVAAFFGQSRFELHETIELRDVRLVYAPPSAIGEYGGETDNWMWPRHTGDFSLLRAYVGADGNPAAHAPENVPYAPAQWLRPSTDDVDPGDFVAVLGYPGVTDRYMWAAELERHQQQWLPMRVRIFGEWIDILEATKQRDAAAGIKVAALAKSLANRHKNAAGKIAGLERLNFAGTRTAEDARLLGDEAAKPTLLALASITAARREREAKAFLLDNLSSAPRSLVIARDLVSWAQQRQKPDTDRQSGYRDRDKDRVWNRLEQSAKDYDAQVDVELLASFLAYADLLEQSQRIAGFDAILGAAKGAGGMPNKRDGVSGPPQPYLDAAKAALEGTALADATALAQMFEDPKQIERSKDPMIVLARALVDDVDELARTKDQERGRLLELEPQYFELVSKFRGSNHYADANGTLRASFATIQGYSKWNDEVQVPQTVLAEAVAKHKDAGEFDLPNAVLAKAKSASASRWVDPELGDVPIAFLADGDTTGGNSGSPVIDSKGQLIGFNFDRVWETVSGDYVWRASQSHNIISDIRFLYWMLEEVAGAKHLLDELGVAGYQPPPSETKPEAKASARADAAKGDAAGKPGSAGAACACNVDEPSRTGSTLALLVLGLLGLSRVRRRS